MLKAFSIFCIALGCGWAGNSASLPACLSILAGPSEKATALAASFPQEIRKGCWVLKRKQDDNPLFYFRWPGTIPYAFDDDVDESLRTRFVAAAEQWAAAANVSFVPRTDQALYLLVRVDPSIFAGGEVHLGVGGGPQEVVFKHQIPDQGLLLHEIGHALGFFHEHQRADRDTFLEILWNNIIPDAAFAFYKDDYNRQETDYDFLSVMHYQYNAFSVNGDRTMLPKAPFTIRFRFSLGGDTLSEGDLTDVALLYGESEDLPLAIPDPELADLLTKAFDFNGDGGITTREAACAYSLNLSGRDIGNLTGLQAFQNIFFLNIDGNRIVDLAPLAAMDRLEYLVARDNQIDEIGPLAAMQSLKGVWLDRNRIKDLSPIESLSRLLVLSLTGNRISDIAPLVRNEHLGMGEPDPFFQFPPSLDLEDNDLTHDHCAQLRELTSRNFESFDFASQRSGLLNCDHPALGDNRRWMPHITHTGGGFQTEIHIANTGLDQDQISLLPYTFEGQALPALKLAIAGESFIRQDAGTLFGAAAVSHFSIEDCEACVVSAGYRVADGRTGGTAHAVETSNKRFDFFIHPGEWDLVFDGLALVNLGETGTAILGRQFDVGGQLLLESVLNENLPPKAKYLLVFETAFPDADAPIEIRADQPMAAVALRGSRAGSEPAYLFQTDERVPLPELSPSRWIPHVTRQGGGFQTLITLTNRLTIPGALSLLPFDKGGEALAAVMVNLNPRENMALPAADLFGSEEVSHFAIEGDYFIAVDAVYRVAEPDIGSTAHVRETNQNRRRYYLYQGEWDTVWDGAAVVNLGDVPAEVAVLRLDPSGGETWREVVLAALPPRAKGLIVFNNTLPDRPQELIVLEASQPVSLVFLRGSLAGETSFLYQTLPFSPP